MAQETEQRVEFSVAAATRHPQELNAYDPIAHHYKSEYIHPTSWQLEIKVGAAPPPENVESYEWTVKKIDGEFEHNYRHRHEAGGLEGISVTVPAQGPYLIELEVEMKSGRQRTYRRHFHLRDFLIVAVGDSYFCGEGTPDKPGMVKPIVGDVACNLATFTKFLVEKTPMQVPMEREAQWQEKKVHRSYQSGPTLAAADAEVPAMGAVITFLNFARSGSSIEQGLLAPREEDDWTTSGQIEEVKRHVGDRPIDALLISTGGNDIDFPDRLIDLIRDDIMFAGAGDDLMGDDALNREQEVAEAVEQLEKLPERLDKLAEAVRGLDAKQVFLMEYPIAHFDTINEKGDVVVSSGCGIFQGIDMDIDGKDAQVIKQSGRRLNRKLRQAAQRHGWIVIDGIADAFAGHGLCSADPYFISAQESCEIQGDFEGTLHVNVKGHRVYRRSIEKALYRYTITPALSENERETSGAKTG